jgi:hypothetical protein
MVDWKRLASVLATPAAMAVGVWLTALATVPAAVLDSSGGAGGLLAAMMQWAYAVAAIRLALDGLADTAGGERQDWSVFPNRYDASAVAVAVLAFLRI